MTPTPLPAVTILPAVHGTAAATSASGVDGWTVAIAIVSVVAVLIAVATVIVAHRSQRESREGTEETITKLKGLLDKQGDLVATQMQAFKDQRYSTAEERLRRRLERLILIEHAIVGVREATGKAALTETGKQLADVLAPFYNAELPSAFRLASNPRPANNETADAALKEIQREITSSQGYLAAIEKKHGPWLTGPPVPLVRVHPPE